MKLVLKILVCFIFMVNFPLINKFILLELDPNTFRYANQDGAYTRIQYFEFKETSISKYNINRFIEATKPTDINKEFYRLYKINLFCFWRWNYYILIASKFKYKPWSEIAPNRVPYNPKNRWQDF
ncbi:hypothetical protein ACL9RF_11960 [Sphingobacterium sp. Mn56C]|uniref:hypothetical protein n=1 Tax=Sphingobacterium sp. Mn56C TaxID=3395261 RepID=UPI003BDC5A8C